jgi:hypothetical protein
MMKIPGEISMQIHGYYIPEVILPHATTARAARSARRPLEVQGGLETHTMRVACITGKAQQEIERCNRLERARDDTLISRGSLDSEGSYTDDPMFAGVVSFYLDTTVRCGRGDSIDEDRCNPQLSRASGTPLFD